MARPAKILLIVAGILAGVLLLAGIAVSVLVNPEDYRDDIAKAAEAATGRKVTLGGKLSLKLMPCCGIDIGNASLGNPPGFGDDPFVSVDDASVRFRLWPLLLRQELVIGRVIVEGLRGDLLRLPDGRANWEFGEQSEAGNAGEDGGSSPASLSLAGLRVGKAQLSYEDQQAGDRYRLDDLTIDTGAVNGTSPFPVKASFKLFDLTAGTAMTVALSTEASADIGASKAKLTGLSVDAAYEDQTLSAAPMTLTVAAGSGDVDYAGDTVVRLDSPAIRVAATALADSGGNATVDLNAGQATMTLADVTRAEFSKPVLRVSASALAGLGSDIGADLRSDAAVITLGEVIRADLTKLDVDMNAIGLASSSGTAVDKVAGKFKADAASVSMADEISVSTPALAGSFEASGPQMPGGKAAADISVRGLDINTDTLAGKIESFEAAVAAPGGGKITLSGAGRLSEKPDMDGTLLLKDTVPRQLLAALDPEPVKTADPKVLGRLDGRGRWFMRGGEAGLSDMDFRLDDTRLTGKVSQGAGEKPMTKLDVTLDAIDADRYLEPDPPPKPPGADGTPAIATPADLPIDTIRDLRLDGRLAIGKLRYDGLALSDVSLTVKSDGGQLRIDSLKAKLYGGSVAGSLGMDARGERASISLDQQLTGLDLAAFLKDFAEVSNISGTASARLAVSGTGNNGDAVLRNLGGNLSLNLADGVYRGMDIWAEIRKARALIRRQPPPASTGANETKIKALELSGPITNGRLSSDKLLAEIPFLRMTGKLGIDLPAETLDADLEATVFEAPTFEDGTSLPDLAGVRIPLKVKGPLASPSVKPDLSRMVKDAVRETAKEAVREKAQKFLDRLGVGAPPADGEPPAEGEPAPAQQQAAPKKEDPLKKGLERLLGR